MSLEISKTELETVQAELKKAEAEIARLVAKVEELSVDARTGLFGGDLLIPKLNKLIEELNHTEEYRLSTINAIMIIALDMDGLKFLNDKYSHAVGNQALIAFANHLKKVTKIGDLIFRPKGSDEFTLLLPITKKDTDFEKLFKRIQDDIHTNFFIEVENKKFQLSSSMGYAVLKKGESKSAQDLFDEADKKEREDKRNKKAKKPN